MRRVSMLDASFLHLESRETPMHVAGLNLFTLPEGADEREFMRELSQVLRSVKEFRKPFGEFITTGRTGPMGASPDQGRSRGSTTRGRMISEGVSA